MKFYNLLKKVAAVRTSFIFAFIGLFFCIGGGVGIALQSRQDDWIKTTATIQQIEENITEEIYNVIVSYTDENGLSHSVNLGSYHSGMKVGQSIEIKYDKNNPENVSDTSSSWMPYLALGVGAVTLIGGSISTVLAVKKSYNDFDKVDSTSFSQEMVQEVANSLEGSNDYIYHIAGKLGYNHLMEDENKNKVFEAKCDRVGFFRANKYTFINHLSHEEEKLDITNPVTTEVEGGNLSIDLSYYFKVNGEKCWDRLGRLGYSLEPHLDGLNKVVFEVRKYGVEVASITTAGVNSIPGAKQYPWGKLTTNTVLKVTCRDSDIDGVAFACFCIVRR